MANDPNSILLEASSPGRRWPTFRDARTLISGRFRVRGWVWLLSMVWVVIGAGGAIYATVALSHPGYQEVLLIPKTIQWPGEPQVIIDAAPVAEVAWGLLSVPVLVAGFVRLRGWRPRNWLRVAGWASSWVAGLALMVQAAGWVAAHDGGYGVNGAVKIGEMTICAAWLVLGALMTWILAVPATRRSKGPAPTDKPAARRGVGESRMSVP
jgi:hypothetical protein